MKIKSVTLGCKVNQCETQAMETSLRERGHEVCAEGEIPDTYIINTCAVTAESVRKSRQAVRRALSTYPDAIIAVCGCFSQLSPEETRKLGAHLVSGSGDRIRFAEDLERVFNDRSEVMLVDDPMSRQLFEELPAGSVAGRTRAMLKIQDGCENFCAYCIIPYVRGPVRSLLPQKAVEQAKRLAEEGFRELVITGIEISSYGKDLHSLSLPELTAMIAEAAPQLRLRLGSLDPSAIDENFCENLPRENLCRHFHLSVQSGCDETLKRMNRKYDVEALLKSVELLRKYFPGCAITGDLIAGFPGETEDEFAKTLETIRKCAFSSMHVFVYSLRPGTAAASMVGHLPEAVKSERAKKARGIAAEMKAHYLKSCIGQDYEVLIETEDGETSCGHADNYCLVKAIGKPGRGEVVTVHITGVSDEILIGNITN